MSFSDLMSSSRGPGVIGMVFALIVLIGFGVLFIFAFDEGLQGGEQTIESFVRDQNKRIERLNVNIAGGGNELLKVPALMKLKKDFLAARKVSMNQQGQIDSLKVGVSSSLERMAKQEREFDDYKNEYRAFARDQAKGRKVEELTARSGEIYKNVTFRKVSAVGIQIRYDAGLKRIPFDDLSDELQDHFQYDPRQKDEAIARELAIRSQHEKAVLASNVAGDEMADVRQEAKHKQEMADVRRAIARKSAEIKSLASQIRRLKMAIPAEREKAISNAPQMERKLSNLTNRMAQLRAETSRLQSGLR